jgi:hypothetical protein
MRESNIVVYDIYIYIYIYIYIIFKYAQDISKYIYCIGGDVESIDEEDVC